VAGVTVGVAVFVCLTEVALKHLAVSETGTIILRGFLIGTLALVTIVVACTTIFAALFDALSETSIQSGLTQVERASEVAVTILVAAEAILVTVVIAILTMSIAPSITFGVISVFERFTEVAAVEFTVAETRAVVFRGFLIAAQVAVFCAAAVPAISAAFLDAFVIAGVQSGSTELRRAAVVTVTIPVATVSLLISIVAAVTVLCVTIVWILRLSSHAQGDPYSKQH